MSRSSSRDVSVPLLRAESATRSRSRPGSRPRTSHLTEHYSHDPEDFINPGAATISEEDTELIQEFIHPHHHLAEETLIEDVDDALEEEEEEFDEEWRSKLPWWRQPSPWWCVLPVMLSLSVHSSSPVSRWQVPRLCALRGHRHVHYCRSQD